MAISKPMTVTLYGERERAAILRWITSSPIDPVRPVTVTLTPFREPPTPAQTGYYRAVVLPALVQRTGYFEHEMHSILLALFAVQAGMQVGEELMDVATFEIRTVQHMSAYLELVLAWATIDLDCYIEPPRQ